jgi:D-3-phosphoglycerate dehydrogenase
LNVEPDGYSEAAASLLAEFAETHHRALSRDELLEAVGQYDALILRLGHRVDAELLDSAARLRVVATATTGLDHIDLEAARARDVEVLSLYGETAFLEGVVATPEHAWALLLAVLRRIPAAFGSFIGGSWDRDRFRGRELAGKTIGIVGLGRVGRKVSSYAAAFDMRVLAFDPFRSDFPSYVTRSENLRSLLSESDVVTIHVPLNADTRGMFDEHALGSMKSDAILVNTSRGAVIDEAALVRVLEEGRIGGAALDVLAEEPDLLSGTAQRLRELAERSDNLVITPHVGGATHESLEKTEIFMARKLRGFLSA